jgi:hypothetical protein
VGSSSGTPAAVSESVGQWVSRSVSESACQQDVKNQ